MKRIKRHKIKKEKMESSSSQQQHEDHDLAYFIHDRVDLMHQVFSLLKYKELKSMAPECIRNLAIGDLQELCTEELLGISSKRLLAILDGAEPPSDTESSSPSPPPDLETISLDSISSDEELLSSSSKKKKHKHRRHNSKTKSKKKDKSKEVDDQQDENGELSRASRAGLTVLELLELQARARAIRAQLQQDQANRRPSETMAVESSHHSTDNEVEIKEEPPDVVEISSEDEKPDVEKLKNNMLSDKITPVKIADSEVGKETEPEQNTQTATTHINNLIITVPQAKPTRRIKLNRNHVSVSIPKESTTCATTVQTEVQNMNVIAKPFASDNLIVDQKLTPEKTNDNKAKKKKKDKKKKSVEKDGSDHDEITLQLSDSEKMDLFEDLDESRKNYERVSSSSEDSETSSSDSEEEKVAKNTSTELEISSVNTGTSLNKNNKIHVDNIFKDPSQEVIFAESTSTNPSQEVTQAENTSINPSQEIKLADNIPENASQKVAIEIITSENTSEEIAFADIASKNESLEVIHADTISANSSGEAVEVKCTSKSPAQEVQLTEITSKNPFQDIQLAESSSIDMLKEIPLQVSTALRSNNTIDHTSEITTKIVSTNDNNDKSVNINEQQMLEQTHNNLIQSSATKFNTENDENVKQSADHTQIKMIVVEDNCSETIAFENHKKKSSTESEKGIVNANLENCSSENLLVTISSNKTRSVITIDKSVHKECSSSESNLEEDKHTEIILIDDVQLLCNREKLDAGKESQNCSKKGELDKESNKKLSDGELSDRQSSEVEAIDVQPEIVCISDEENPKSKHSKKKKKKEKKSKKEKKNKKSKSDFREGADQNFYRDIDTLADADNKSGNGPISFTVKITTKGETIDLDSDEVYEIMELSDASSCYEVEGTVLSKEPTAKEIEALSAKIDEIEREEVVTDEQIRQHEQMLVAQENDGQSDENVDHMSWKDRYLGSNKVKRVLTTANILNALRKKNKELKKKIEESKIREDIEIAKDDQVSQDNVIVEKIEEGSIGQYNTLEGSTKYVDPVMERVEDEIKDADTIKEQCAKLEIKEKNVTIEMKKDAKQLLKMYKRLMKHNDIKIQKDPNKKKKKKQKKKDKQDKPKNMTEANI